MNNGAPRGVKLGVDYGQTRIGVARCDEQGILATPLETLWAAGDPDIDGEEIARLASAEGAKLIYLGLPYHLSGREGQSAAGARRLAAAIVEANPSLTVRLIDERLSTVSAHRHLANAGRSTRKRKNVVDQVAAVLILEQALTIEKTTGRYAGKPLEQKGDH